MYSFPYLEPVCCSMSSSSCCVLTCIQISQRQVRWSGISISFRIFHSLLWSTYSKAFGIVNKAEIDVFLELSHFFDDPADVGNLTSGSSAFSKSNLNIWKFTAHLLLNPGQSTLQKRWYKWSIREMKRCLTFLNSVIQMKTTMKYHNVSTRKHLLLLYWLRQSLWLCESQQTVESS